MPSPDENIPFLVTFSKSSDKTWGDDDNIQIYFFSIPQDIKTPFYIRIYDVDNGGKYDENRNGFNSKTKFSVYGGKGAHSNTASKGTDPNGNYNSGILLNTKTMINGLISDQSTQQRENYKLKWVMCLSWLLKEPMVMTEIFTD